MVTDDRAAFESEDDNVIFLWVSVSIYYYRSIYHWIYFAKVGGPRVLAVDVNVR